MRYLFLLFSIPILLFGCSNSDDSNKIIDETTFPANIEFSLISSGGLQGSSSENMPEGNRVITTSSEWMELMDQMNLESVYSDPYTQTDMDFSQYMLLGTFDAIRPNSGYWIQIEDVTEEQDSVFVEVSIGNEPEGYEVMNRPFHIVKIPITDKPIEFQ